MKPIDAIWFSNMTSTAGIVGIVVVEDEKTKERKAYIGIGEGNDEKLDTKRIMDFGSPFRIERVAEILNAKGVK